MTVTVKVQGR